jgi:two-component system chemotaxis response regulator CheY
MMLRQYPLVHAYDGREGLDALAQNADVDLILLDINMPRMNGLEFLGVVKKDAKLKKIPVIIVTTEGANQDAEKGLAAGASAYVKKPFRNEELLGVIDKLTAAA